MEDIKTTDTMQINKMANTTVITVRPMATAMSSMTKATLLNNKNLRDKTIDKRHMLSSPTDLANRTRAMLKAARKTTALTIDSTIHGTNKNQTEVDIILQMARECKDRRSSRGTRIIEGARLKLRGKTPGMVILLGIAPITHLGRKIDANWSPGMAMETEGKLENQW
jgi:hypothetical protein